ncbi:MAG: multidrug effflux MFS transporter [Bacteroidales bacterium]|nr:multidrug effflux MFS transporter [Bacteroidales bacterium]
MTLKTNNKYFVPITTLMLAWLTAMSPFATDTYLSAMPNMADFFSVHLSLVEITLSIYFLGFAVGNFFGGPLSDSFGRKTIALTGVILYLFSALAISVSHRIELVWVFRFTQAFGGGFASVTSMVFVRDWFKGKQVAKLATLIGMIMMLAPLFAPLIGSLLLELNGWQTIFHFMVVFAFVLFVAFYVIMPESRQKSMITRKLTTQQLIGKYKLFFSNRNAVMVLLTVSFAVAGMFTFLTGASFTYIQYFGVGLGVFPLLFAVNVICNLILSLLNTVLLKRFEPEQLVRAGLYIQFLSGAFLMVLAYFSQPSIWIVVLLIVSFMGSLGMVFGNSTAIILNLLPEISGSANAMIGVVRFLFSSVAASLPALFYTGTLVPMTTVMFICTLLANFFFFRFLRTRQKAAKTVSDL